MNLYTSTVQAHIIVTLMLGPGHSFKTLKHIDLGTSEEQQISIAEFMDRLLIDIMNLMMTNPLLSMSEKFNDL